MQLVLNNNTFDVQSFTEILSFREGENGKYANMALMIYLDYPQSLTDLVPLFNEMDFSTFTIGEREYENFFFENIEQVVGENFTSITTTLHLNKQL